MRNNKPPREGDLFMRVAVDKYVFELKYGYYDERDRILGDPIPIYPDLKKNPIYTKEGFLIVTAIQDGCENYTPAECRDDENICSSCIYYPDVKDEIGVCQCMHRRQAQNINK